MGRMDEYLARIELPGLDGAQVHSVAGAERMNALADIRLVVAVPSRVDPSSIIGKAATLVLYAESADGQERRIPLVATALDALGEGVSSFAYSLTLAPPAWPLTRRKAHRVWVDKTTQDIVKDVIGSTFTMKWRLSGDYMKRLQCVQYGETDWAFVERLLAEEGIAYYWNADDAGPILVLADDPGSHDGIDGGPIEFHEEHFANSAPSFFELESRVQVTSQSVHLRDFDVRQPSKLIEGKAGPGAFEVFEYPANVLDEASAKKRAKTRLDQLRRDEHVIHVRGDTLRPRPGFLLEIENCPLDEGNGKFLVVSIEHEYEQRSDGEEGERAYDNRVVLVPIGERTHRPDIVRNAPRVSELESAVITGQAGQEIHVDDLGRVKVRMFWDRAGIADDRSSTWVRCLQMGMGGSMLLPRVGWEVPVVYQNGNPDCPIVLGRIYNTSAVVPYDLPAAAMKTTLQSATSPADGTTNEIRMDDTAGKQEFFVHASKDHTVEIFGNETTTIHNNETYDIGLSHGVGVGGTHHHTVGAKQTIAVGTDHILTVKGTRADTVAAMEKIDVTGDVIVSVKGAYVEAIGAIHGLECNQSNTNVKGAFTQAVGASMNVAGAMGTAENVAAARLETITGSRIICTGKYTEHVTGAKSVTAGATSDTTGKDLVTKVTGTVMVKSGSLKLNATGSVVMTAKEVKFDISGALTAGALSLASGTLKATKGTTKVKGTIKRQGETKIE